MIVSRAAVSRSLLSVRPATPVDAGKIREMLERAALPADGVADGLPDVLVGEVGGTVVAVARLEVSGTVGLLRSVVVQPDRRSGWRGSEIVRAMLQRAAAQGPAELFLLTTTARGFFERLGFRIAPRDAAPLPIQCTEQFSTLCPSSAVLMRRAL